MIYTVRSQDSRMEVDTDRVVEKYLKDGMAYVHSKARNERAQLILKLEEDGFVCRNGDGRSREAIIESLFPLMIRFREKSISCVGNVTSAAAAASSRIITDIGGLCLLYSLYRSMGDHVLDE